MSKINTSRSADNIPVFDVITADNLVQNNKLLFCWQPQSVQKLNTKLQLSSNTVSGMQQQRYYNRLPTRVAHCTKLVKQLKLKTTSLFAQTKFSSLVHTNYEGKTVVRGMCLSLRRTSKMVHSLTSIKLYSHRVLLLLSVTLTSNSKMYHLKISRTTTEDV